MTIATVAADLGYADQAHLSADFRQVLGRAPSDYRRATADPTTHEKGVTPRASRG